MDKIIPVIEFHINGIHTESENDIVIIYDKSILKKIISMIKFPILIKNIPPNLKFSIVGIICKCSDNDGHAIFVTDGNNILGPFQASHKIIANSIGNQNPLFKTKMYSHISNYKPICGTPTNKSVPNTPTSKTPSPILNITPPPTPKLKNTISTPFRNSFFNLAVMDPIFTPMRLIKVSQETQTTIKRKNFIRPPNIQTSPSYFFK